MSVVHKLKYPFQFGDREITELTFERLKGKHLKGISEKPSMVDLMNLASKSAKEAPAIFDEMDAEDVTDVAEIIGGFFGSSR